MSQWTVANPFLQHLGVELVRWENDCAELEMEIVPWMLNRVGALQGGVVSALLDAACAYAGFYAPPGEEERHGVTISLSVDFLASANAGVLKATGRRLGGGRTIFFAQSEVRSADGTLIAIGHGSFKYRSRAVAIEKGMIGHE